MFELITSIVTWCQTNWATLLEGYLVIVGLASWIVKLTPTLKDDDALKWVIRFIGKYIAVNRGSTPDA